MNFEKLKLLKTELLAERQKELDAVEAKHKRKLDALAILLEDGDEPPPADQIRTPTDYAKTMNKLGATREAVEYCKSGRFTTAKLFGYVKQKYPQMAEKPSDLSNSVWVLKKSEGNYNCEGGRGPR